MTFYLMILAFIAALLGLIAACWGLAYAIVEVGGWLYNRFGTWSLWVAGVAVLLLPIPVLYLLGL